MLPTLSQMCVSSDASLREALKCIDENAQGICFIVEERRLEAVLTDGDARRAILAGTELTKPAIDVATRNFTALPYDSSQERVQQHLSDRIKHIPLIDENGLLIDYACAHRYRSIALVEPLFDGNELAYVTDCINSRWISSKGKYVQRFEEQFSEYCGVHQALAVSNGTVAIHLALVALGIGEGDEVIVPNLTFAAPANAVIYTGAKPVLVDVEPKSWNIDPRQIVRAITEKTKAIIPVHLYGHPCDMDEILKIAKAYGLKVIEDCAEALGTRYRGQLVGSFGDAATFSFFGNKTVTTGEGGMVLFADKATAELGRILRDHGMSPKLRYWHDLVGFNYRMTNLQAAVGVAQMERVSTLVDRKREMALRYRESLHGFDSISLPPELEWATNSYWLFTILLNEDIAKHRDNIVRDMLKNGVETRPVFYPLHQMAPYTSMIRGDGTYPISCSISQRGISLPSSTLVDKGIIAQVSRTLIESVSRYRDELMLSSQVGT